MSNEILKTFSARAPGYDAESKWVQSEELITPMIPHNLFGTGTALDVCSGTGVIGMALESRGWNVTCTDVSSAMLERCKVGHRIVASIESLPFPDDYFDLTVLRQGLHYADIDKAFNELKRVTKFQIRLGHITMMNKTDLDWWTRYFQLASPGRKVIFYPGQVESFCHRFSLKVVSVKVLYARDRLMGPIMHLSQETKEHIRSEWENAPDWFSSAYSLQPTGDGDFLYAHRWEFITADVSKRDD